MDRQQLEKLLLASNVPNDVYSLSGGLPSEAFCLEKEKERWHVYYSERGMKTNIGYFENEETACECLLKEIKKVIRVN